MSSLITQGLGKRNLIISKGLGIFELIKKIVKKVISRFIPVLRRPFKMEIPVMGDLVRDFKMQIRVTGKKDFSQLKWLLLEEEDEDV